MKRRFSADEWLNLSPKERIELCRAMAQEATALSLADATPSRRSYQDLADQWTRLADEMEALLDEEGSGSDL